LAFLRRVTDRLVDLQGQLIARQDDVAQRHVKLHADTAPRRAIKRYRAQKRPGGVFDHITPNWYGGIPKLDIPNNPILQQPRQSRSSPDDSP